MSRSAGTRCCRWMTAFTRFSPRSRASRALLCTAAFSVMALVACPRSKATSPSARGSRLIPWATSTSTSEGRTEQGKLYLFVAIDRTSRFAFVELHERATTRVSADFLRRLIAAVPYKIHTVLTDNGTQFTTPGTGGSAVRLIREALAAGEIFRAHAFELACARAGIDHRTTQPRHPWTNGQVERMNRTLKEATVRRFHYESHDQLRRHLDDFVPAYNFARRLKSLKGLTPFEFICKTWASEPQRFTANPLHQMPGLNI